MKADLVIFGGGIAGLWSLAALRQAGINAILIDPKKLGGMQSLASQGMIHGGQRYALQGSNNSHSTMLKDLPEIWNSCLDGSGPLDLSKVKVLAKTQLMWSPGALTDRVAAFFASKVMQSEVKGLPRSEWPKGLNDNCGRAGAVYELQEVVIDCNSLFHELLRLTEGACFQGRAIAFSRSERGAISGVTVKRGASDNDDGDTLHIEAKGFIAAAGLGNEQLRDMIGASHVQTQVRPLKQIYVKEAPFDLFAHCITTDPRPRATITTHISASGERIWYMGGLVGVYGVDKSDEEALDFAKKEMRALFPKVDWSDASWGTLSVDRAEPKVDSGFLPDGPAMIEGEDNFLFTWPTKMTFAPALGADTVKWAADKLSLNGGASLLGSAAKQEIALEGAVVDSPPWERISWSGDDKEQLKPTAY